MPDDQRDIFERLCDFYNGYDPSIGVQMTLSSRHEDKNGNLFGMDAQGDALDDMRVEASMPNRFPFLSSWRVLRVICTPMEGS